MTPRDPLEEKARGLEGACWQVILDALRDAVEGEREECIRVADNHSNNCGACGCDGWQIAEELRARGGSSEEGA
jgi:hypothetical protein